MIMKQFCHAILACGVFAAIVAAASCTKDATGGGGGGYDGEPEVNHDMDGILRRNYLWNEEYATLSPDFDLPYDESKGRFYEEFIYGDYRGADLRGYALNLPRLYVIVSSGTASASEAVVNGLRGIGLEVVLVGQKTNGKNVGMEGVYLEDGAYEYLFMPVSFQGYNARLETVDPNGLAPDALKADWNNGYEEFGSLDDDCLEYAVTSITGQSVRSSEPAAQRRPGVRLVEGLSLPEISCRPEGMILLPPDAVRED